jgi:hypothetical protein
MKRARCCGLFFCVPFFVRSVTHKQGHQRVGADLTAPMAVHGGVKRGPFGQGVGRIEKLAGPKNARAAVLQKDLHMPPQHKQPLRVARAMECAAKTHRALAQLASCSRHQGRQLALGRAFGQGHKLVSKACAAIGVGEQNDFFQLCHGRVSLEEIRRPDCRRAVAQPENRAALLA